jgi:iron complex transport system substrate-binding protein
MRLSRPFPWLVAVLVAVLAACGTGQSASPGSQASQAASSSAVGSTAPSPSAIAYPLSLTDDEDTTVTLAHAPKKIVSLTPASTETLFAIGAGPKVVGRTDADDYPAEAKAVPTVASYTGVDVEKIVGLGADLVIAGGNGFNPPESITKLRSLGIPVVVVYAADVQGVLDDIRLVGQAAGNPNQAEALAASMGDQLDAIKTATAGVATPRVFYEIGATPAIYGPADQSFLAEMVSLAGGDPVTTGSTTAYEISLEKLVAANPEIILLGDAAYSPDVTAAQVASRPGWGTMAAVQDHRIFPVDDVVITRPGPRLMQGLVDLVKAIHPELVIPGDSGAPAASPVPAAS